MEDIRADIATMYEVLGFNGLLEAVNTMLLRKWDRDNRDPVLAHGLGDLTRELARLKKARLPLTDAERAAVKERGILWYPTPVAE